MTAPASIQPGELPGDDPRLPRGARGPGRRRRHRRVQPGAVVVDQGEAFRGTGGILGFPRGAAAGFTYTTELLGAQRIDDTCWVATNRLEGDVPGGVADLDHRFTTDALVAELVIAPR